MKLSHNSISTWKWITFNVKLSHKLHSIWNSHINYIECESFTSLTFHVKLSIELYLLSKRTVTGQNKSKDIYRSWCVWKSLMKIFSKNCSLYLFLPKDVFPAPVCHCRPSDTNRIYPKTSDITSALIYNRQHTSLFFWEQNKFVS